MRSPIISFKKFFLSIKEKKSRVLSRDFRGPSESTLLSRTLKTTETPTSRERSAPKIPPSSEKLFLLSMKTNQTKKNRSKRRSTGSEWRSLSTTLSYSRTRNTAILCFPLRTARNSLTVGKKWTRASPPKTTTWRASKKPRKKVFRTFLCWNRSISRVEKRGKKKEEKGMFVRSTTTASSESNWTKFPAKKRPLWWSRTFPTSTIRNSWESELTNNFLVNTIFFIYQWIWRIIAIEGMPLLTFKTSSLLRTFFWNSTTKSGPNSTPRKSAKFSMLEFKEDWCARSTSKTRLSWNRPKISTDHTCKEKESRSNFKSLLKKILLKSLYYLIPFFAHCYAVSFVAIF